MTAATPTALSPTTRYIPAGTRHYVWIPAVANPLAPTAAEITAGTDLTGEIPTAGVSGFTTTADDVDAGDYGSSFKKVIPGLASAASSSIRTYASSTSTDARALLIDGLNGFIGVFNEGLATGKKYNLFPVRVKSTDEEQVAAGDAATIMSEFSITGTPIKNIAAP